MTDKAGMGVGWGYLAGFNSRIHGVNAEIQRITMEKWGLDPMAKNVRDGFWTNKHGKLQFRNPLFYVRPVYSLMYFLCAPHIDVIQDDERLVTGGIRYLFPPGKNIYLNP